MEKQLAIKKTVFPDKRIPTYNKFIQYIRKEVDKLRIHNQLKNAA